MKFYESVSFNGRLPKPVRAAASQDSVSISVDVPEQLLERMRREGKDPAVLLKRLLMEHENPDWRKVNVRARTINLKTGEVEQEANIHNIIINYGRVWHRDLISVTGYPGGHTVRLNSPENLINHTPAVDITLEATAVSKHRPRYIALGVGGNKQSISPPGPGSLYETVTVVGLERPVQTSGGLVPYWMKQVDGQALGNEEYYPDYFPSAYAVRYRTLFDDDDVSFVDQPIYGADVPISEYLLLTSQADRSLEPANGDGLGIVYGACAYCTASPIVKTPLNGLEVIWEFRT